jgi:hypothetical protein
MLVVFNRWGRFPICPHGPAAHQLNMKTMWDRRCRLSIRTKGGKVLLGLDLRSLRLGPAPTFFKGVPLELCSVFLSRKQNVLNINSTC